MQLPEDNTVRKRTSGFTDKINTDRIDDLEEEIEVEEIMPNEITESIVISVNNEKIDIDDESMSDANMKDDLMSPVGNKKGDLESDEDVN